MKPIQLFCALALLLQAVLLQSCGGSDDVFSASPGDPPAPPPPGPPGPPGPPPSTTQLGDPIPGLTQSELDAFERGRLIFERRFKPSEGLGPRYNATSCSSCHSTPVSGGGAELYRNFYVAKYGFTPQGSSPLPFLPSLVIPAFGSAEGNEFGLTHGRFIIPEDFFGIPVTVAQRNSIPIFGTGLFEFVTDATILAGSDPDDEDGDGISGRANTEPLGVGRFGLKAQANNIEGFTRAPLETQMGITTEPFLGSAGKVSMAASAMLQATTGPDKPTTDLDGVPDPELSHDELGDLIAFTRFLAPPEPKPFDEAALRGELQFAALGCAKCHLPSLPSSRGEVRAYTDLLLHDMGPELADGISAGTPQLSSQDPEHTANEFRTQPLWGISNFGPYLHDGRAASLHEAVVMHGGEAQAARDAFVTLSRQEQDDLIVFMEHL